jgi:tetratricopeptide (TPR) repeat protein
MNALIPANRSLRFGRHLALAIALASGSAIVGTFGFADVAHAQKKKKEEAPKAQYSKEFTVAYKAVEEQVNAGPDMAVVAPKLDELVAMAVSPDEKMASGQMLYNTGIKSKDNTLQLRGVELMLASGKTPPEAVGQFNYIAFQLNYILKQPAQARAYLQRAIDNKFATEQVSNATMQFQLSQLLFNDDMHSEGFKVLRAAIEARKAEVGKAEQTWYGTGIKVGLDNQVVPDIYDFLTFWLADNPEKIIWKDAITIVRTLAVLDDRGNEEALLDLLRLSQAVGTLERGQDYEIFVDIAKAARYPKEVRALINQGVDSGAVAAGNTWMKEQLATADRTLAADRTELPATEAAANKPGATLAQVMNAGRTFLSYGEHAKAAGFFEKALAMPGAPQAEVLQRLGMAQLGMGDHAAAVETFGKVQDATRMPVAMLWSSYAKQQMNGVQAGG